MLYQPGQVFYRALKRQFARDDDARPRALDRSSPMGNAGSLASSSHRPAVRIMLRLPVILMVLAATAMPVELRPLYYATLNFGISVSDVVANVVGYVPVGIVLGGLGPLRAVIVASLISTFAETGQLMMMHRTPSPIDIASNTIGAILGMIFCVRWGMRAPGFRLNRWKALVAAALAFMLGLAVLAMPRGAINARGAASPGILEAYWKLDESRGRIALDSSGHGLHGKFSNEPTRVAGAQGGVVTLDGATDYIDFGHSPALRLFGSMTISAWINSTSFPVDDAAIVSHLNNNLGYQLDTTVDRGLRTIGFKLTDACGSLMARYGATPLVADRWYYVAGVYDAEVQTLNVYLNGELDNGFLLGSVTGRQRSDLAAVYVGRRSDLKGFEFAGSINDVRLYSRALTKAEIASDMHATVIDGLAAQHTTERGVDNSRASGRPKDLGVPCVGLSDYEDAMIPGMAAALGVLAAVASVGLWPSARSLLCLVVSLAVGLLLLPATASTLPSFNLWMLPLLSLVGGASVAVSVRRQNDPDP
jgi:VanZ family protein